MWAPSLQLLWVEIPAGLRAAPGLPAPTHFPNQKPGQKAPGSAPACGLSISTAPERWKWHFPQEAGHVLGHRGHRTTWVTERLL